VNWRPSSGPDVARERADLLSRVRRYFDARNVLEVDTPSISTATVTDPHVDSLQVRSSALPASDLYLQTSPEYAMKRLLADGYPDIFSIARVYRDGEVGRRHQPEFTMIEWYRHGFELDDIVADTVGLIAAVLDTASDSVTLTYRDAFIDAIGLDPMSVSVDALANACGADDTLRSSIGDVRDHWLDLCFAERVSKTFPADRLTVVKHYPASQAALARLSAADPGVAERFEVFSGELELANGYVELSDACALRQRFERDRGEREARGHTAPAIDERFMAAMVHGMPACAGVALGFERLHMLYRGTQDIRDVLTFTFNVEDM